MIHYKEQPAGLWILMSLDTEGYNWNTEKREWVPFSTLKPVRLTMVAPGDDKASVVEGRLVYVAYLVGTMDWFEGVEDEKYKYAIGYSKHEVALMAGPELPQTDFELIDMEELGWKEGWDNV